VGDDADLKMISSVVGNSEAVIRTSDLELFKKLLRFVSVTASKLVSESHTTGTEPTSADIVKKAKEELDLDDDITAKLKKDQYNPEPPAPTPNSVDWDDGMW
jgi:hypothetical protein